MAENVSVDPRERGPKPPFPQPEQSAPGSDRQLKPPADHGETSYKGSNRLQGKVALITGGDSGIGRAIAIVFAKEGADVVFTHLPEEKEDAAETVKQVEKTGRRALDIPGDVRQKSFCQQLVQQTVKQFGKLDILVNNAAFQRTHEKLEDVSEEEFDTTFRTNVYGTFFMTQAALPEMKPGGSIINTVSIQAYDPESTLVAYAATKSALVSLTKTLAQFAIKQGVRVNGVAPGPVWTPLIPSTMPAEKVKTFGQTSLFGRPAQPVEEAAIYAFLASDDASYVTAEIYGATGGQMPI